MAKHLIPIIFLTTLGLPAFASEPVQWKASSVETRAGEAQSAIVKSSQSGESQGDSEAQKSSAKTLQARQQAAFHDVWIYDAFVTLYQDTDNDGYYQGISLEFDADTDVSYAYVYARLYLGVGDTFYEYYTTNDFALEWDSSDDSLIVETELLEGFAPRDYEVMIELYDADTHELLTVYDGYDDNDLVYLPMESRDYDYYTPTRVTVSTEHGGAAGWTMLGLMLLIFGLRNRH